MVEGTVIFLSEARGERSVRDELLGVEEGGEREIVRVL